MAKRGHYSNETQEQAEQFVNSLGGSVEDALEKAFERAEMIWDEVDNGERDQEDSDEATTLVNYLSYLKRRDK